jgi:hypothetical protein
MRAPSRSPGSQALFNAPGESEGLRIAKLFRKHRVGGDVRRCDLDAICIEDELEQVEARHAGDSYTACLCRSEDGIGGLIVLAPGQERGRKRFSIAHELGHYHIPKHKQSGAGGVCSDRDMRGSHHALRLQEREANDFATEVLMPRRAFTEDAKKLDISIAAARTLASPDYYDVSGMAATWRIVETTREPAAMVVSVDGRVEWMVRSASFRIHLPERGQLLHEQSVAAEAFRSRSTIANPSDVPMPAWIDEQMASVSGTLLESSLYIPTLNQVVSLLWLTDADSDDSTNGPS